MSFRRYGLLDLASLDTDLLSVLLERAGWRLVGGKPGEYSRFARQDDFDSGHASKILVPLNRNNRDYGELLGEAIDQLDQLSRSFPEIASPVLDRLTGTPGDEVRFRKDTATVGGAVPWLVGQDLYSSARGLLLAGAKSRMTRRPYFGQTHWRFASRFL